MKKIIPNITYKSVLSGIKNISERNKAFDELDAQSKRLEIAWDCLNLVTKKVIMANECGYWDGKIDDMKYENSGMSSEQFQKELLTNKTIQGCKVCARGGMMLSTIRLGNKLTPKQYNLSSGNEDILQGFAMDDFFAMENEYESNDYGHPYETDTEEKLANICCNVLVNGNFDMDDKTDYLIVKES